MSKSEQIKCPNCNKYVWPNFQDSNGKTVKNIDELDLFFGFIDFIFMMIGLLFFVSFNYAVSIYIAIGLFILYLFVKKMGKKKKAEQVEAQNFYPICPKCKEDLF
jgi:hypothetical protein